MADRLEKSLAPDPRAFAKLLRGEALRVAGNPRAAIPMLKDAARLVDVWLVHFELGRAYLDLNAFAEAQTELTTCLARRGEGANLFLDDFPTQRYIPSVHYYLARAQEGLNDPAAQASYAAFVALAPEATEPIARDARRRLRGGR